MTTPIPIIPISRRSIWVYSSSAMIDPFEPAAQETRRTMRQDEADGHHQLAGPDGNEHRTEGSRITKDR